MKYGLIMHKPTTNIGDDIQSYAIKQFLPHVDYYLDREFLDEFVPENGEPVATIFAAWWMWQKWNWPPSKYIIPKFVSMHINNYDIKRNSSPITTEWLTGIGKQYFDAYSPVGVRDTTSVEYMRVNGIDAYFSGCITLTLPKQPVTPDKGKYVVIADLRPELKKKAYEWLKDSGLEIREITHRYSYRKDTEATMEERLEKAESILSLYCNAKFVITRRLHVTLPCLAMEVPVMSIVNLKSKGNYTRWAPYSDWVNYISEQDFLSGNFDFDFINPPSNKDDYLPTRNALIESISSFINEMEAFGDAPLSEVSKITYTDEEEKDWRFNLMRNTLENWLYENRKLLKDYKKQKSSLKQYQSQIEKLKIDNARLIEENKKIRLNPIRSILGKFKRIIKR